MKFKDKRIKKWLRTLKKQLFFLSLKEREDIIFYYEEQINEAIHQEEKIDQILLKYNIKQIVEDNLNNLPYLDKMKIIKSKNYTSNIFNSIIAWPFAFLLFLGPIIIFIVFAFLAIISPGGIFIFSFLPFIALDPSRAATYMVSCWFVAIFVFFVSYLITAVVWKYFIRYFIKYSFSLFDKSEKIEKLINFSFFPLFKKISKIWWIFILIFSLVCFLICGLCGFVGDNSVFGGWINNEYYHTQTTSNVLTPESKFNGKSINTYDEIDIDVKKLTYNGSVVVKEDSSEEYNLDILRHHRMKKSDNLSYYFNVISDDGSTLSLMINQELPWYDILFSQSQSFELTCGSKIKIINN